MCRALYLLGEPGGVVVEEISAQGEHTGGIRHPDLQVRYPDGLVAQHLRQVQSRQNGRYTTDLGPEHRTRKKTREGTPRTFSTRQRGVNTHAPTPLLLS